MITQVKKLLKVRSEFFSIAKEVEYDFDMLASILTPVQRAKFILFVDSVRNHHDLSVYELWDIKKSGRPRDPAHEVMESEEAKEPVVDTQMEPTEMKPTQLEEYDTLMEEQKKKFEEA